MSAPSILISGAGIGGPTLASWLSAAGWDVTLVERFGDVRDEGQNVDVRGAGREVLRRMGLEEAVRGATTGETGMDLVDEKGAPFASMEAGTGDSDGPTAELEVLRGRLSRILVDHCAGGGDGGVEQLFGVQVTAFDDDGEGVTVTLSDETTRRVDVVVIAEGLRSRTRALVMPEASIHELGVYCAYLTIPRVETDTDRWRWFVADHGRNVMLRPDGIGTTRALVTLRTHVRGLDRLDRADFVAVLRATFADVGWEAPRVLAALDDAPMYVEAIGQARLESWSRGRIALVGDAAYAASPFSGVGATLALTGAYVLAGELTSNDDPRTAFARYEERLRPMVTTAQEGVRPGIMHPETKRQRSVLRFGARVVSSPVGAKIGALLGARSSAEVLELPEYAMRDHRTPAQPRQ